MPTANSSTTLTGSLGKAVIAGYLVYRLTNWSLTTSCSETAWGDSDSAGYTERAAGRKDGTGSITGKYSTERTMYSLFVAGDIAKLVLWQNATLYWALPRVLFSNFTIGFNPDTREVVEWSADYGADGRYYYPGESGAPTETLPTS